MKSPSSSSSSTMPDSDADKKRNKLGYRRITVACTHCRRRKIRCLPQEGDPHDRCQTCIRLKKECVYNPVDLPPGAENGAYGPGTTGLDTTAPSTVSSSPRTISGGLLDYRRDSADVRSIGAGRHFQGIPVEANNSSSVQDPSFSPEYGYPHPEEGHHPWSSGAYVPPTTEGQRHHGGRMDWSYSNNINPTNGYQAFSNNQLPYPPMPYSNGRGMPHYAYPPEGGEHWLTPVRSTSVGPSSITPPQLHAPGAYGREGFDLYAPTEVQPHSLAVQSVSMTAPSPYVTSPGFFSSPGTGMQRDERNGRSLSYTPAPSQREDWYHHMPAADHKRRSSTEEDTRHARELQQLC